MQVKPTQVQLVRLTCTPVFIRFSLFATPAAAPLDPATPLDCAAALVAATTDYNCTFHLIAVAPLLSPRFGR